MRGVELEACQSFGGGPGLAHAAYKLCLFSSFVEDYATVLDSPCSGNLKDRICGSMLD